MSYHFEGVVKVVLVQFGLDVGMERKSDDICSLLAGCLPLTTYATLDSSLV
jgi:hypothetical protein